MSAFQHVSASLEAPLPRLEGVRVLVLFGGAELFGQERANIEVFSVLRELGVKAKFVISSRWGDKVIRPEIERRGFEFTTAPFGFHWGRYFFGRYFYYFFRNLWGMAQTSWRVWWEARRWRATHVYAPNWLHLTYAIPGIWLGCLPLVYRAGDELPQQTQFHRWFCRWLFWRVRILVCNADFLRQKMVAIGLPADKVRVIYNHPPRRTEQTAGKTPETPPGAAVILFVGQISEHKGVALLVEAMIRLLREGRTCVLWLAGDSMWGGKLRETLLARANEAGLAGQFVFLRYVQQVPELFHRADIHVCPSVWDEPSPNVVFEAKQAGVPSVVFPVGGIPELIEHEVDGFICSERTAEALASGIAWFLDHPEERKRAGEAARRSLDEKFGERRFQREWAEVFQSTAGVRKRDEC